MTDLTERMGRLETKLDTLIERLDGKLTKHEVALAKMHMQGKMVLWLLGLVALGGGGAASLLKIFGG